MSELSTGDQRSVDRSTPPASSGEPWIELLTSGTTGPSKCIGLSAANFEAHAATNARHSGASASDRHYCCLPMFHVGALAMITRAAIEGASVVIAQSFDPQRFLDDAERHRLTHASLVSTQLIRVLDLLGTRPFPDSFKAILVGGGPVTPAVMRRAREKGAPVLQTYGLTEACSQVCTEQLGDADGTSAGKPLPGVEVSIIDGRIHVGGPTVAPMFGGSLDTGDLGYFDERGRLHVLSRRTDLIVTGGENVYPFEVEQALLDIPGVTDAAVAAVSDPVWGQRVTAAIVGTPDDATLTATLKQRLAGFKVPRDYLRLAELPRNATGKVDRRALQGLLEMACNGPARRP
ncbi:MAG: AMP-binding protein [Myxococcaceae bacterium]